MQIQLDRNRKYGFSTLKIVERKGKLFLKTDFDKVRVYPPLEILRVFKAKRILKIWFMDQVHLIQYYRDDWSHKEGFKVKLIEELNQYEYWEFFD